MQSAKLKSWPPMARDIVLDASLVPVDRPLGEWKPRRGDEGGDRRDARETAPGGGQEDSPTTRLGDLAGPGAEAKVR